MTEGSETEQSPAPGASRGTVRALAAVVLLGLLVMGAVAILPETGKAPSVLEISFAGFDGGEPVALGDLEGEPVIVNYWASWCAPCIAEMPELEEAFQKYGDQVRFIGVNTRDNPEAAVKLAAQTGVTYPLGTDETGETIQRFMEVSEIPARTGMPVTVFIDSRGNVREMYLGRLNLQILDDKIAEYFGL